MANELAYEKGFPLTLHYIATDLATNATTDLTLSNGGAGFIVPTGYKFHAVALHVEGNADVASGGSRVFKVVDDGTELANGPVVTISNGTQAAVGVERVGTQPIAAGSVVAVSAAANTTGAATIDYDAILVGILTPA